MKILLLTDIRGKGQEGLKNLAQSYYKYLKKDNNVLTVPPKRFYLYLSKINRFKPDIVHMLNGPSIKTFGVLFLLKFIFPYPKYFASLTQVDYKIFKWKRILKLFKSIKLFSQDPHAENFFRKLGFSVSPLPNGIDMRKFRGSRKQELPAELEEFFKKNRNRKILLHVGHIKEKRGLEILAHINDFNNWQVLIIGSTHFPSEKKIEDFLIENNCFIYKGYLDNIEEVYRRADAYIFPVTNITGAIDLPLTVLEALANGVPVVTTKFKAVPRFLRECREIYFFENFFELEKQLLTLESKRGQKRVAQVCVEKFDIGVISEKLLEYYKEEKGK